MPAATASAMLPAVVLALLLASTPGSVHADNDEGNLPPAQSDESIFSWFRRLPFFQSDDASTAAARGSAGHPSIVPLARPLWSELTPAQQSALAPFAREWNSWPPSDKKAWLQIADRMPQMSAEQQQRTRERIQEWSRLGMAERRQARQNYRMARQHPAPERAQAWQGYQNLTNEQRSVLRSAASASTTASNPEAGPSALAPRAQQPLPRLGMTPPAAVQRTPPAPKPASPLLTPDLVTPAGEAAPGAAGAAPSATGATPAAAAVAPAAAGTTHDGVAQPSP